MATFHRSPRTLTFPIRYSTTVAPKLRRNFGFIFSFFGRAMFIMFCGTLLLATGNWIGYLVGGITFGESCVRGASSIRSILVLFDSSACPRMP